MRVVSPFKPFVPESPEHQALGPFDWVGALKMLAASVTETNHCDTIALTDRRTTLGVPAFRYDTTQPRLMLWILEVILAYLSSDDFDQDTVMVSPDTLIFGDLSGYFVGDLTVLVRSQATYAARPVLNAVQWWPVASKAKLVSFYQDAVAIAQTLPEDLIVWGGDTEPLRRLIDPIVLGVHKRRDMKVWMLESRLVMHSLSAAQCMQLDNGTPVTRPSVPITDFKYRRKLYQRAFYDATIAKDLLQEVRK